MSFKMRALGLLANQFFAGSFDEYLLPLAVKTFSMLKCIYLAAETAVKVRQESSC